MAKKLANLTIDVWYDPEVTTLDEVAEALDQLLDNALSTQGVLDSVGNPDVGSFEFEVDEDEGEEEAGTVICKSCRQPCRADTAHAHDGGYVGDECCWDERLRTTE